MRVGERVYWIGSGILGMNMTDELDCNVYLLDGGSEWAMIDTGAGYGVGRIVEELEKDGFRLDRLRYIALTHAHADHAGGAAEIRRRSGAAIAASELTAAMVEAADEEAMGLRQAREAGVYPADYSFAPCPADVKLRGGMKLRVGELTLDVLMTPGHSRDMAAYYCPELRTLFSGDTVFARGEIARLSTPDFSLEELRASLRKLVRLEVESLMPGHMAPVVRDGGLPIRQALRMFDRDEIPRSLV
ncbi:Glyoxylase, beta-lactamase superfamily II [Paenibacillus sp. UNCCL117]|uniref:MBL fold metallo-hydrolase n=1 Tax=unclassified Paenibacillus TaxID=185978 RepID=UPI000882C7BC|nr:MULTISPECIES: MBL fold metallo-hydrolase [unclassified Paenibacillus]SDD24348.1 Glyoxylase, beta-lactamase superfamily II [Paenibacillus sp. cl123]SFW41506.1 Glyoxylase, beta-lactamase superfamily II [Paenibacillus sp. UNCCL117]